MGKKMKIPYPWPWPPYCQQPRTLSFRATTDADNNQNMVFKTIYTSSNYYNNINDDVNDVVNVDTNPTTTIACSSSISFTNSLDNPSFPTSSTNSDQQDFDAETLIKGLARSEGRLFFEPRKSETSSILEEAKSIMHIEEHGEEGFLLSKAEKKEEEKKTIMALPMESRDPYFDFKKSMEEMVEANQELKRDWDGLEELLFCYLRVNSKSNHCYILSAFVDLLISLFVDSTSNTNEPSSSRSYRHHSEYNKISRSYNHHSSSPSLSFSTSFDDSSNSTPCESSSLGLVEEVEEEIGISSPCLNKN